MPRIFLSMIFATLTSAAFAQEPGDARRGLEFAEKNCTGCHAVRAGEAASPVQTAPSFTAVANSPGMTSIALSAFFRTPHKSMPNFIISSKDIADVTAYILSLKGQR